MRLRFTTIFFLVLLIAFHVVLIVSFMYWNSSFEGLKEVKVLGGPINIILDENFRVRYTNNTMSDQALQRKTQNGDSTANSNVIASQGLTDSSLASSTDENEKLLHGLLASGFDESSCISRVQSRLYSKASPHKPSPYLISKLRIYEELHRKCGPYTSSYNTTMTNIENSNKNNNAATMCKYIVWIPYNGLGNRILSLASTFLYALLTDRVLLVKFGNDMENLFCEPFLNSTWILSKNTLFWNQRHIETIRNSNQDSPSVQFINLCHNPSENQKTFHCDPSQHLLNKVPLLIFFSDQYFLPYLFIIPLFNKELDEMFPDKDTVFHHLARYLFHPSNDTWELISKFYQTHLAKADERIGIQIRVHNPFSTPLEAFMNLLLSCTKKYNILPELAGTQNSSVSSMKGKKQSVKAVLVASLYAQYGDTLKGMYVNKTTVTGEIIQVYQASHEGIQKYNDNEHNMKALTDMYLLSLSDKLVTTSMSTFGYVAQGLGNLMPLHLYKVPQNETHIPVCEMGLSIEPCYHIPFKYYCDRKRIQGSVSSVFPRLRECRDYLFGVKLVHGSM